MKIQIEFLNGSRYWREKVTRNAEQASRVLSDPEFLGKIAAWPGFDYTKARPSEVADKLEQANVGLANENARLQEALKEAQYDLERIMTADWTAEQMRFGAQSGAHRVRVALGEVEKTKCKS